MTPRAILKGYFPINRYEVEPSRLFPCFDDIAHRVGSHPACDGISSYDVFICYREASDALVADRLYSFLKRVGIHPFLDKKELPASGNGWKSSVKSGA